MTGQAPKSARVAVAVSGSGRSLANLLQHPQAGFCIAGVIASRADCHGVAIAREHGLPLFIGDFSSANIGSELEAWINPLAIDWVALAGFLKLFPVSERWRQRVVNIHPALLPRFGGPGMYGNKVHAAVLSSGDPHTGATVHYVNSRYDEGAIIAQISVPVQPGDTTQSLADRVFAAECKLYPAVLQGLVSGSLPRADGLIERFPHADL